MQERYVAAAVVGSMFSGMATASAQQPGTLTQQPGTIVEMVLKPCVPGVPRNQCGVSLKLVQGGATFTTTSGETITLSQANQTANINGLGAVTQSSQAGTILNFAAAGTSGPTTGSLAGGGGGGGGGSIGSLGPNGGSNVGSPATTTAAAIPNNVSGFSTLTSSGVAGTSSGVPGISNSASPSQP